MYGGDADFTNSTAPVLNETVDRATPGIQLNAAELRRDLATPVTLSAKASAFACIRFPLIDLVVVVAPPVRDRPMIRLVCGAAGATRRL
jgi:hypothetical protein